MFKRELKKVLIEIAGLAEVHHKRWGMYAAIKMIFCSACHFSLTDIDDIDYFLTEGLNIDFETPDYY